MTFSSLGAKDVVSMALIRGLTCLFLLTGCSSENLFEGQTEETEDEAARALLEKEDWDGAITAYEALIAKEPSEYFRFPLLAAAYAGRSGVSVLAIMEGVINSAASGGGGDGGVISAIGNHVPPEPTDAQMSDIRAAILRVEAMPQDHRSGTAYSYSSETSTQLTIYFGAESAMILNKYTPEETDAVTAEDLENMSDAEVDAMIANISSMAEAGGEDLGPAAEEALAAINSAEGATQKEKLINYLSENG